MVSDSPVINDSSTSASPLFITVSTTTWLPASKIMMSSKTISFRLSLLSTPSLLTLTLASEIIFNLSKVFLLRYS